MHQVRARGRVVAALPLIRATLLACLAPSVLMASSHREAPLIADDPQADNTDVYAFRSRDAPTTVTLIANYIPAEKPQSGPLTNCIRESPAIHSPTGNPSSTTFCRPSVTCCA